MAIDTTGMNDSGAGQPITKFETASGMSQLDDNDLLQELGLGDEEAIPSEDVEGEVEPVVEDDLPLDDAPAEDEGEVEDAEATGDKEAEGEDAEEEVVPGVGDRTLQAQFQVFDAEGELEIPDLQIKFKANGEDRELPLDHVVKLAQRGFYDEELVQQVKEFREVKPQYEQALQDLQDQNRMLTDGWRRVLSGDEEYLAHEQEAFFQASSPEARAARAEEEVQQMRQQNAEQQQEQVARQFVSSLVPRFGDLEQTAPSVSFEEIVGRFNVLTAPLMVRGQIPPQQYREVVRIIDNELRPWAEARHAERSAEKSVATESVKRETAKTAAMKRQVSRAVMPKGTHAPEAPKKAKKYESAQDILDDLPSIVRDSNRAG